MKFYSAIKQNEVFIYTTTWMKYENIVLNEKTKSRKIIYCMTAFI